MRLNLIIDRYQPLPQDRLNPSYISARPQRRAGTKHQTLPAKALGGLTQLIERPHPKNNFLGIGSISKFIHVTTALTYGLWLDYNPSSAFGKEFLLVKSYLKGYNL